MFEPLKLQPSALKPLIRLKLPFIVKFVVSSKAPLRSTDEAATPMHTTPHLKPSHNPKHADEGFTLIELMVVVAILATLTALAAPSFTPMLDRWRVRQAVESMVSTLYFARSEGVKRGGAVVIIKNGNSATCTLAPNNSDWGCGWTVFFDTNRNGSQDAGEPTLQTSQAPNNTEITIPMNGGRINVDRWGAFNGMSATAITFVPKDKTVSDQAAAAICVSSGGRIRTVAGNGIC